MFTGPMTSLLDKTWAGSTAFVGWLIALGVSVGAGLSATVWMIQAGFRHDADGTSPTNGETALGWGGLLFGIVLFAVSVLAVVRSGRPCRCSSAVRQAQ